MADKMKPCPVPWCRCDKSFMVAMPGSRGGWARRCCKCGTTGPECPTEAEAIAAWNTRPESAIEKSARETGRHWSSTLTMRYRGGVRDLMPEVASALDALAAAVKEAA